MKIIYTIAGLYRPAGMERILTSKANYLSEHGYDVVIVTTEQKNRPLAFPLNQGIRCVDIKPQLKTLTRDSAQTHCVPYWQMNTIYRNQLLILST